jgi:hypothetical protein
LIDVDGIMTNGSEVEKVDAREKKKSSSTTLLLIVGLNLGLLLMAGIIGAMCYTKRSAGSPQFYSKVPGMYECHMGDAVGFMALILLSFSLSLLSTGQCSQNSNPQRCLAHPQVADMGSLLDRELSDYYTEISLWAEDLFRRFRKRIGVL